MFDADIFRPTDVWLAAQSHATGCVATRKICVVYVSSKLIKRCVTGVEMGPGVDGVLHISFLGGGGRSLQLDYGTRRRR